MKGTRFRGCTFEVCFVTSIVHVSSVSAWGRPVTGLDQFRMSLRSAGVIFVHRKGLGGITCLSEQERLGINGDQFGFSSVYYRVKNTCVLDEYSVLVHCVSRSLPNTRGSRNHKGVSRARHLTKKTPNKCKAKFSRGGFPDKQEDIRTKRNTCRLACGPDPHQ